MGMVFNNAKVTPKDTILVIGCGGIGLCAIHAASIAGMKKIIAVDINDEALKYALSMGADGVINNAKEKGQWVSYVYQTD